MAAIREAFRSDVTKRSMVDESEKTREGTSAAGGRGVVILMVALMVGGTAAWNAWDYLGTEGLDPKKVKAMAKEYEKECMEDLGDERTCKRHIGRWHRECLPSGIDRAAPDEPTRKLRYDLESYTACMRPKRGKE